MGNTWIINLSHYLNDSGYIVSDLQGSAKKIADFFGNITAQITASKEPMIEQQLDVKCRRRPKRIPCIR